ncbi:hypothetical protein N7490_011057 [Penicillium lividum]|nr:hypothetical protein N7490_011057 [Penicillium lividum]
MDSPSRKTSAGVPFTHAVQLSDDLDRSPESLPGYPRIKTNDTQGLYEFIFKELWSSDLEAMANRLWWMSKEDGSNISPLHRHLVKGREIVVTEDSKLHLVWIQNRIFIKPLPRFLTSHTFWRDFLADASQHPHVVPIRKAALGFLRTYFYLIKYESDFRIAKSENLRLASEKVTWEQFCYFSIEFLTISDAEVSGRYSYGEIRLTRLNYYAPLLITKTHFQKVEYQYKDYFAQFQGPILFTFAILSILLSSMQVNLAAPDMDETLNSMILTRLCYWSSTVIAVFTCLMSIFLIGLFLFKIGREWTFAIRNRRHRKKNYRRGVLKVIASNDQA